MQIQKPLLASAFDPDKAQFPYLATPKIDGIRFLMIDGQAVSRSFKPIRNRYIQERLECLPDGIDGEITCGDNFQVSLSGPALDDHRASEVAHGRSRVHALVSEYANGTYTVEYTVTVAGLYYVMVTRGGEPIQGAPFRMQAVLNRVLLCFFCKPM